MVITVGKYVTPNHKDINGNGIELDFQKFPGRFALLFFCLYSFSPGDPNVTYMLIVPSLLDLVYAAWDDVRQHFGKCTVPPQG